MDMFFEEMEKRFNDIKKYLSCLPAYYDYSDNEIITILVHSKHDRKFIENDCSYREIGADIPFARDNLFEYSEYMTVRKGLKIHLKLLKKEQERRAEQRKQLELERKEQIIFSLELDKQRLAQEHELKKMEIRLQIEETKLLREREERQANRSSIDSLRDSLKDD